MAGKERYSAQTIAAALTQSRGMISYAAQMLGCSHMTVRRSMARHAVVREAREAAIEGIIDLAELRVVEAAAAGNLSACYFILKTLGGRRGWSETMTVQANVVKQDFRYPRSLRTDYDAYNKAYSEAIESAIALARAEAAETGSGWQALMAGGDRAGADGDADAEDDQR
jgi:hypothetical protein